MDTDTDLVAIIEAAYTFEGDQKSWLRRLGRAALPMLDRGLGLLAFTFDASNVHHVICSEQIAIGAATEELARDLTAMNAEVPSEILAHVFLSLAGFGTASELSGQGDSFSEDPYYKRFAHQHGMYDFLGLVGLNPPGTGVVLGTPMSSVEATEPAERMMWTKVTAHIAAAARLREVAFDSQTQGTPLEEAEAILAPDGSVEHAKGHAAEKDAREQLSEAVRDIELAKGSLRRKAPEEALERWPSLLHRRWTVHETEDSDGRRLLVARVNMPRPKILEGMSLPQRQVAWYCAHRHPTELIAYELGMQLEDVERHLVSLASLFSVTQGEDLSSFLSARIFESEPE